jgi:hypothetical protein
VCCLKKGSTTHDLGQDRLGRTPQEAGQTIHLVTGAGRGVPARDLPTGSASMARKHSHSLDLDEGAQSRWCDSKDSDGGAVIAPYRTGCGVG